MDGVWVGRKGRGDGKRTVIIRAPARAPEGQGGVCEVGFPGEVDEVVVVVAEAVGGALWVEPGDCGAAGGEEEGEEGEEEEGGEGGEGE